MPIQVVAEQELFVRRPIVVEGSAPTGSYVAVFKDDGDTGYFDALDTSSGGQPKNRHASCGQCRRL